MTHSNFLPLALCCVMVALVVSAGCLHQPTGCVPVMISDKRVGDTNSLTVTIEGVDYGYYNPSLLTYDVIKVNQTNYVKFIPMFGEPCVKLCSDTRGYP